MGKTILTTMIILCVSFLLYSKITILSIAKIQHDSSVDLLIDYGNGTAAWSTIFLSPGNNTAFSATQKGADSLTFSHFGDDIFVDAINGVRNNFTSGYWWAIFTWNHSISMWSVLDIACNKHVMEDGGMVAWYYAIHPWPPTSPVDPPQTQIEVLVDYGNGTSKWNTASLIGAANAFKATQTSVDSLDYSVSDFGVFVDAINGVRNNFTSGYWWALFFWNGSAWEGSLVGADSLVLSDGGMVAWFYSVHPWPPVPPPAPPSVQVNVLVNYGNGTSSWKTVSINGTADAFKATTIAVDNLDYSVSDFGVFVDAINGVRNNFTSGYWWALFFWNGSAWEGSLVGADSLVLSDGGMVAWFYSVHPWPPVPPPAPLAGDVNVDGRVDLQDLINAASIYGSREGDLDYNSFADLASEWGVINIFDVATIAYHYGEEYG